MWCFIRKTKLKNFKVCKFSHFRYQASMSCPLVWLIRVSGIKWLGNRPRIRHLTDIANLLLTVRKCTYQEKSSLTHIVPNTRRGKKSRFKWKYVIHTNSSSFDSFLNYPFLSILCDSTKKRGSRSIRKLPVENFRLIRS